MKRFWIHNCLFCICCLCVLCSCQKNIQYEKPSGGLSTPGSNFLQGSGAVAEGKELFSVTDSLADAEEIAELYNIEFVEYINGVASFHTEEDLYTVIQRGTENNWPILEINYVSKLF